MASDKVNRLQSLMQNQDLKDNHVEETLVKETLAEADPFGVAPVDWGTEGYSDEQKRSLGDTPPLGMGFVPILAVAKYPYKFITASPTIVDNVSKGFFAAQKFWGRKWTVFFVYPPVHISIKPIHLVPSSEVKALLREINQTLKLQLDFPVRAEQRGFYLEFPDDGQPRPQFLGISSSKQAFNVMEKQTPSVHDPLVKGAETLAISSDDRSFTAFASKMEAAFLATKANAKASKEAKKLQRVQQKDALCRQLRRTQRYLGIRPRSTNDIWSMPEPPRMDVPGQTWQEYVRAKEEYDEMHQQKLPALLCKIAVPYPFEQEVVFICVDVEAYEKSHKTITEVGISSIDTLDLNGVPPGPGGANWLGKINSRHFRIKEHKHLVNKDFIVGCPDRFEKEFGESEFISIKEAPQVVASCFRTPFARRTSKLTAIQEVPEELKDEKRKLILVGHNAKQDVEYLREMGYDVGNLSNLVEVLDTAELYRALAHEENPTSLGILLYHLGLSGWNLHNAGNDAAYTLQALIGVAFKGLASKAERQPKGFVEKVGEAAKEAAERVAEDSEEWAVADGTDDGGVPIYNLEKPKDSSRGRGGNRGASGNHGRTRAGPAGGSQIPIHAQGTPLRQSRQGSYASRDAYTSQDSFGESSGRGGYGDWEEGHGGVQLGRGSYGDSSPRRQGSRRDSGAGHGRGAHTGRGNYGEGSSRGQGNTRRRSRGHSGAEPAEPTGEEPAGPKPYLCETLWW